MNSNRREGMGNGILDLWKNMKLKNKLFISTTLIIILITISILISVDRVITENMLKNKTLGDA